MELKEYLRILKKEKFTIVAIVTLAVLLGLFYSQKQAPGYKIEQTFLIEATRSADTGQPEIYQIPAFSTQEEARNFTDTAVALLKDKDSSTPPHVRVSAQKEAPQLVKITVSAPTPQEAKIYIQKTKENFNKKAKTLIFENIITLKPVDDEPEAVQNIIDSKIILPLSLFAGLTLATLLTGLKTYFRL